jgi:hypothetical protein
MNDFWNKILPGSVKTDHGRFNGADLLIVVINLLLFAYTAYRSWRFLNGTFAGTDTTGEFTIMAIIGLVGLDIAAVAWSIVWMFGSTTKWQDTVSLVMFVVSVIGMILTSMVDTLNGEGTTPEVLKIAAFYGVPAIILMNVTAGIVYHMISPQVSLSRKERRMRSEITETQRLGEIAQRDTAMKLDLAEKQMQQNDALIERQQRLAQQKMILDGVQLGISQAMSDDTTVKRKGERVRAEITRGVEPPAPQSQSKQAFVKQTPAAHPAANGEADDMTLHNQAPVLTMPPASPASPAPDLQQMMFLVHLDTNGAVCSWRVHNEEKRQGGVHWDSAYNMYAVLVRADDGIDAGKRASEMLQPYLNGSNGSAPKA